MVTPENFILKLGTRDYVDEVTCYTIFDADRLSGGFSPKQVKHNPFVSFFLSCPVLFTTRAQCSHCKRCISYGNSVRLSVRLHTPVLCQKDGT